MALTHKTRPRSSAGDEPLIYSLWDDHGVGMLQICISNMKRVMGLLLWTLPTQSSQAVLVAISQPKPFRKTEAKPGDKSFPSAFQSKSLGKRHAYEPIKFRNFCCATLNVGPHFIAQFDATAAGTYF